MSETVLLADELPELVDDVPQDQRSRAAAATVASMTSARQGQWDPPSMGEAALGLLVLDGLLVRRVVIGERECVELLGRGDLLRPWTTLDERNSSITVDSRWSIMGGARFALLDGAFARRIAPWPEMTSVFMDSLVRRSRWLAFHLAICHLPSLSLRVRVMLWFLADRWGRVTRDGVVIPLQLTHRLLAGLVGARRPATTTAIGRLQSSGQVSRRADGAYVVHGEPPAELTSMHDAAAGLEFDI